MSTLATPPPDRPTRTANHRPGCERPGWNTAPSTNIPNLNIARCTDCGAVELQQSAGDPMDAGSSERPHGRRQIPARVGGGT